MDTMCPDAETLSLCVCDSLQWYSKNHNYDPNPSH